MQLRKLEVLMGLSNRCSKERGALRSCTKWKLFLGKRVRQESYQQEKRKDSSRQGHIPLGGRAMGLIR